MINQIFESQSYDLVRGISALHSFVENKEVNEQLKVDFDRLLHSLCFRALEEAEENNFPLATDMCRLAYDYAFNIFTKCKAEICLKKVHQMKSLKSIYDEFDADDFYIDEFEID